MIETDISNQLAPSLLRLLVHSHIGMQGDSTTAGSSVLTSELLLEAVIWRRLRRRKQCFDL
jgi:hypothetical protein